MSMDVPNNTHEICALLSQRCKNPDNSTPGMNTTCFSLIVEKYGCGRDRRSTEIPPTTIDDDTDVKLAVIIILLTIAVFSFFSNAFVCLVYALSKEIRTAKHYFIVNLAAADILIAGIAIPFFVASYFYDASFDFCQTGSVIDVLCCTSSIVNFAAISLERFIAIKCPLRYSSIVVRKRCLLAVAFVWLYSIVVAVLAYAPIGNLHFNHCVFFSKPYILASTFASFLLPLCIMLATYGWIFRIVKYQASQINSNTPSGVRVNVNHEFKAAKTLMLIIGVFILSWCPFFVYICLSVFSADAVSSTGLYYTVQVIRYVNSLANPFIYVGINRDFRRKALKLLKDWSLSRNDDVVTNRSITMATSFRNYTIQSINSSYSADDPTEQSTAPD